MRLNTWRGTLWKLVLTKVMFEDSQRREFWLTSLEGRVVELNYMYIYVGRRFKRNLWLNTDKLLLLKGKKFCIVHI